GRNELRPYKISKTPNISSHFSSTIPSFFTLHPSPFTSSPVFGRNELRPYKISKTPNISSRFSSTIPSFFTLCPHHYLSILNFLIS
ncbi:MAG: hypothetical protein MJZ52_07740, partial [Bacteroidales bacterium]|nr:hypothetical protein [Bacteroidales bacterium]